MPDANDPDVWLYTAQGDFESCPGRLSPGNGKASVLVSRDLVDHPRPLALVVDVEPSPVVRSVFRLELLTEAANGSVVIATASFRVTRSLGPGPDTAGIDLDELRTLRGDWEPAANPGTHLAPSARVRAAVSRFAQREVFAVTDRRGENLPPAPSPPQNAAFALGRGTRKSFFCAIWPKVCGE